MSGLPTDDAYHVLERIFNNPLSHLQHGHLAGSRGRAITPTRPGYFFDHPDDTSEDTLSDDGMHDGYANLTPLLPSKHPLPPTPPSRSPEQVDSAQPKSNSPMLLPTGGSPHSYKVRVSTPMHQRQPPTPEITPPNTRERLMIPRPRLSHYASSQASQADSFVTAREDQRSIASHSPLHLLVEEREERGQNTQETIPRTPSPVYVHDSAEEDEIAHLGQVTPTRSNPTPSVPDQNRPTSQASKDLHAHGDNISEPDNDRMKNVTIRKVRHKPGLLLDGSSAQSSPSKRKKERMTQVTQGMNLHDRSRAERQSQESTHAGDDKHAENDKHAEWSSQMNDILYAHIREEKSKRLSGNSWNSGIVEAIVFSNPPQPRRTLRHAGKNLALRDGTSSLSWSRRTSAESNGTSHQALRHTKPSISSHGLTGFNSSDLRQTRHVSSPERTVYAPVVIFNRLLLV